MKVRDLMEREVMTLSVTDTLDLADDIMRLGRVRHLPVLEDGRVVGLVTQRDLLRTAVSSLLRLDPSRERQWLAKVEIRTVMVTNVHTVAPDAEMRQAVSAMLRHKIGCLPVVENDRMVGIVTETDGLRYLEHVLALAEGRKGLPELAD